MKARFFPFIFLIFVKFLQVIAFLIVSFLLGPLFLPCQIYCRILHIEPFIKFSIVHQFDFFHQGLQFLPFAVLATISGSLPFFFFEQAQYFLKKRFQFLNLPIKRDSQVNFSSITNFTVYHVGPFSVSFWPMRSNCLRPTASKWHTSFSL